jgi:hypothetical protein
MASSRVSVVTGVVSRWVAGRAEPVVNGCGPPGAGVLDGAELADGTASNGCGGLLLLGATAGLLAAVRGVAVLANRSAWWW